MVASIIVAEVIFGALIRDKMQAEVGAATLADALGNLSQELYGRHLLGAIPEITSHERADRSDCRCREACGTQNLRSCEGRSQESLQQGSVKDGCRSFARDQPRSVGKAREDLGHRQGLCRGR